MFKTNSSTPIEYSPNFILSLWFFIREYNDPKSFWRPYFDILPKKLESIIYWNDEELNLVKDTNLYSECIQIIDSLKSIFSYLHSIDQSITLDDINYAFSIFSSRSFPVQIKDENHTSIYTFKPIDPSAKPFDNIESCLVPYADIFNHSLDSTVTYVSNCKDEVYSLVFECPPNRNDVELFNNYGCKDNQSLIRSYGFMLKHNPYDCFYVKLKIGPDVREKEYRKQMMIDLGIYQDRYEIYEHSIPEKFIQTMRINTISEEESAFYRHDHPELDINKPVSIRSEVGMYKALLKFFNKKLELLPSLPPISDNISQYRYDIANSYLTSQRKILTSTIQRVEDMMNSFFKENMDKANDSFKDFNDVEVGENYNEWIKQVETIRSYNDSKTFGVNVETIRIPQQFCLSRVSILESSFGEKLKEVNEELIQNIETDLLIILYILYSYYNEDQFHHQYIKSLEPFLKRSILLNQDEIDKIIEIGLGFELEEDILQVIECTYSYFETDVHPSYEELFDLEKYSFDMFKFAYALILSSVNMIDNDDDDNPLIILPFPRRYDEFSSYEIYYDEKEKSFRILSTGRIEPGDSPFILYDNLNYKTDLNTIIYHNYFNENNPHQYVPLELYVDNDELDDLRFEKISKFQVTLLPKLNRNNIPYPIIYYGRIMAMTKKQLEDENIDVRHMINEDNEKKAFQLINEILNNLKQTYQSTTPSNPLSLVDRMIENNIKIIEYNIDVIRKLMNQDELKIES